MQAAWLSVRPTVAILIGQLESTAASNQIPHLERVGLLGDDLIFKLSIFDRARDELRDGLRRVGATPREGLFSEVGEL